MVKNRRTGIACLALAAALAVVAGAVPGTISPVWAAQACPAADGTATVALIDGSVTTLDVATVGQIPAALGQATEPDAVAALAAIIAASGYPTAAVLAAANCLGGDTGTITKAAAQASPADLEEALKLLAYEPGVDPDDIVAALNAVGETQLAAKLAEFNVVNAPQQPRLRDRIQSRVSETFENPNQISPRTP